MKKEGTPNSPGRVDGGNQIPFFVPSSGNNNNVSDDSRASGIPPRDGGPSPNAPRADIPPRDGRPHQNNPPGYQHSGIRFDQMTRMTQDQLINYRNTCLEERSRSKRNRTDEVVRAARGFFETARGFTAMGPEIIRFMSDAFQHEYIMEKKIQAEQDRNFERALDFAMKRDANNFNGALPQRPNPDANNWMSSQVTSTNGGAPTFGTTSERCNPRKRKHGCGANK